jgi:hypothetical protein
MSKPHASFQVIDFPELLLIEKGNSCTLSGMPDRIRTAPGQLCSQSIPVSPALGAKRSRLLPGTVTLQQFRSI